MIEYNHDERKRVNAMIMSVGRVNLQFSFGTVGEAAKGETVASRRHKPFDRRESHLGAGKSHSTGVELI